MVIKKFSYFFLCVFALLVFNFYFQSSSANKLVSFTLQNDLTQNITLIIRKNKMILQSGSTYRFEKPVGEKFYFLNKDKNPQLLFEVDSSFENKNFKISHFF